MSLTKEEILQINSRLREPFKTVTFIEEGHKYLIEGADVNIKSVSSVLKFLYEPFDTKKIAPRWAKQRGLTKEDTILAWEGEGDIANAHGSRVHLFGENYVKWKYFGLKERPVVFDKQSLGCVQFINDLPDYLIPVATELIMFCPLLWFVGTCDGILYNTRNGKFIIYDYKTNKALTEEDFVKPPLKYVNPLHGLVQDNFGKYSAQFSFYQILLEQAGFEVESRVLVWLKEDKETKKLYQTFKTKKITTDLRAFLDLKLHI